MGDSCDLLAGVGDFGVELDAYVGGGVGDKLEVHFVIQGFLPGVASVANCLDSFELFDEAEILGVDRDGDGWLE